MAAQLFSFHKKKINNSSEYLQLLPIYTVISKFKIEDFKINLYWTLCLQQKLFKAILRV